MKNTVKRVKNIIKNILSYFNFPYYTKQELLFCFEFGLVLSETAKAMDKEVTSEVSKRAEDILINELSLHSLEKTAYDFTPLILAALEV
jgi:hypothetical protein